MARDYEKADGRRKNAPWLNKIICALSYSQRGRFLDLGAGKGHVTCLAAKFFDEVVAYDVSPRMLDYISHRNNITTIVGPGEDINYSDGYFDVVCTFAVLHHIENLVPVFREIHRVLKPGGVYYSDHDLERHYVERHPFLIKAYRMIRNQKKKFARIHPRAGELYNSTEHWSQGLAADNVEVALTSMGFKVSISYHWQGFLPINKECNQGKAPLMRIFAVKK